MLSAEDRLMASGFALKYVVTATKPFREDKKWINRFGEILYMNYPEDNVFYPSDVENCYVWQIQFADGNRMDLGVCTRKYALEHLELFQDTAVELSKKQNFVYDFEQAENSLNFLQHVRKLPANAKEIYP